MFSVFILLVLFAAGLNLQVEAKTSGWKDSHGTVFRGEPMEILGPWALFKTGSVDGRRVLLHGLSPEDSRRLFEEISHRAGRSSSWASAQGSVTQEMIGRTLQLKGKSLVPAALGGMPEPELLLVLFGSHNDGESWEMLNGNLNAVYHRVQRVYPGLLGAVFIGVRHNNAEHREMAIQSNIPWLIADYPEEVNLRQLARFAPAEGAKMVLLSREGVPLLSARATDRDAMREFVDQMSEILWQINPLNALNWKDRAAYFGAVRPVEFAQSHSDPLLIGSPLRAPGLRKYGVTRIDARLEVAADGKVSPVLRSTAAEVPPDLVAPLTDALRRVVVLPAIDHGVAVSGGIDYILNVPPEDRQAEAEASWFSTTNYPVLPIEQWLLLRPIKVSEQDFVSSIESETSSGMIVFKAVQVSDAKVSHAAQMNAFNTDWFSAAGADSVRPKEGEKQSVDGNDLTWQRVKADKGFVNMQPGITNLDYTVGYAWTEFDVPAEGNAWLGLGSDDGVKIWFNGELVHEKWVRRMSRIDDDVVPLHLKKGSNRLLLKIQNATIDWSFVYRIRTEPK